MKNFPDAFVFLKRFWQPIIITAAITFLYAAVLPRLVQAWWTDENYSHGILIPFLIGYLIWSEKSRWTKIEKRPAFAAGIAFVLSGIFLLLIGTLGAELFTQRISLVVLLFGIAVYFWGWRVIQFLFVPFVLLLLAIPIPTILFNQIAFPLQLLATDLAVWAIRLFALPVAKLGNVIELLPQGAVQAVQFEVVEACSGIRSLMTLMTLALVFAFFTRKNIAFEKITFWRNSDFWRALILMLTALPIAVVTNAARIVGTVSTAYFYGKEVADGFLHELSGWLVYLAALALLFTVSLIFDKCLKLTKTTKNENGKSELKQAFASFQQFTFSHFGILILILLAGGAFVHWRESAGEPRVERKLLKSFPEKIGAWEKFGDDARFDATVESVLRTDDYLMRDYYVPANGRTANIYVGYYFTQRTGATYHSPRNCLPGSGWTMNEPEMIEIALPNEQKFTANRYILEHDGEKFLMIYWYQGRGRFVANEYSDKMLTIWDSVRLRRSDGSLVRVVTNLEKDENAAVKAAVDLSSQLAVNLTEFVPN